jgi:hypothetical protein
MAAGIATVSEMELVEALLNARVGPGGEVGMAVDELAALTGHTSAWVCSRLRPLVVSGRVRCVRMAGTRIDGQAYQRPGYVLAK